MIRLPVQRLFILVLFLLSGIALHAQVIPPPPPPPPPPFPAATKETKTNVNDSDAVLLVVEENAAFPGGDEGLAKFLRENTTYPQRCKDSAYTATIYMRFVVEKDGSISNIEPARESKDCPEFAEECKRVISLMPRWKPGTMQGRRVRVQCIVPFRFNIR